MRPTTVGTQRSSPAATGLFTAHPRESPSLLSRNFVPLRVGAGLRRTFFDDYAHELDLQRIRPTDADTDYVDSGDIPGIMETWLHARSDSHDDIGPCNLEHTERMLSDYILGDIEHLITLSHRIPFSE